ncbi:DC-STAMP domain-containing protein 2-like [Clytia hemisphaerica]|uniref:DC-STAMP domain-containing protein 2-like n=1 Tax=Clytia hemisphaerica TaxID=252671 RepID=UPI0034D78318
MLSTSKEKILSLKRLSIRRVGSFIDTIEQQLQHEEKLPSLQDDSDQQSVSIKQVIIEWLFTSKYAAIFFSIFYTLLMYLYIAFTFASNSNEIDLTFSNQYNFTFTCGDKNSSHSKTKPNSQSYTEGSEANYHIIAIGVSIFLGLLLLWRGLYSKQVRCLCMLVLPGIVAGRGRTILTTATISFIMDGPITNINYNLNQVVKSQTCMYEAIKETSCFYNKQLEEIILKSSALLREQRQRMESEYDELRQRVKNSTQKVKEELRARQQELQRQISDLKKGMSTIRDVIQQLNSPCKVANSVLSELEKVGKAFLDLFTRKRREVLDCGNVIPFPNIDINSELDINALKELQEWMQDVVPDFKVPLFGEKPDFRQMLNAPNIREIREQIMNLLSNVFGFFRKYVTVLKKLCIVISLILLITISYCYLRNYYADDSFDNLFIDDNIKILWRKYPEEWPKLTPLRHWELDTKYQVSASVRLSKKDGKQILMRALPSVALSALTIFILATDYALAQLLSSLVTHGKFAISFGDVPNAGVSKQLKNGNSTAWQMWDINKMDLSSEPCLPRPIFTNKSNIATILMMILTMFLSCLFDTYLSRLRPWICNQFYCERAKERARFMYAKLQHGRNARKLKLRWIVCQEVKRRQQINKFSFFYSWRKERSEIVDSCPGCGWKMQSTSEHKKIFVELNRLQSESSEVPICLDCAKDL